MVILNPPSCFLKLPVPSLPVRGSADHEEVPCPLPQEEYSLSWLPESLRLFLSKLRLLR